MAKGKTYKAIHTALRNWDKPTREGLEMFSHLRTPLTFGYYPNTSLIRERLAINDMLVFYLEEIAKLKPHWAEIVLRRFRDQESIKKVAFDIHISEDQLNRTQRDAIQLLADLIDDEEKRNFVIVLDER